MADSLFVIDSTFLLETSHNTFYGAPLLHDSSGRDTTMLFGFARDLLRLRKQLGMRKALIVIGDTGSCVPGPLVSDTVDLLKRLRVWGTGCTTLRSCPSWHVNPSIRESAMLPDLLWRSARQRHIETSM